MTTSTHFCPLCGKAADSYIQPIWHNDDGELKAVGQVPMITCRTPGCDWKGITYSVSHVEFVTLTHQDTTWTIGFITDNESVITLIQNFAGVRQFESYPALEYDDHAGSFLIHYKLLSNLVGALMLTGVIDVLA